MIEETVKEKEQTGDGSISELEALTAKCEEYLSGWKRAKADYENLKKESGQSAAQSYGLAIASVISQLLPIYDHFKMALSHVPPEAKEQDWVKGFGHIKEEVSSFFKKFDVKETLSVGEKFNPELHEAVSYEESGQPEGTVIKELKAGYTMAGQLLSPARVVVAKSKV